MANSFYHWTAILIKWNLIFNFFGMKSLKNKNLKLKIVLLLVIFSVPFTSAQKPQRIAYIDMDYILENVPEYLEAQNTLDRKVTKWRGELDKLSRYIEKLKTDLANERAILTEDLINDKEDEITLKQEELRRLESLYFGPKGDMFLLRKQLVKPVQDQVYNSIQSIVIKKRYDFVFDKSSDLVMLYSNKKYDISELILNDIVRERKLKANKEKRAKKVAPKRELTEKQKKAIADREAAKKKKEEERIAQRKKIEDARKKRLKDIEEKRRILKEKKEAARKKKEQEKKEQDNN